MFFVDKMSWYGTLVIRNLFKLVMNFMFEILKVVLMNASFTYQVTSTSASKEECSTAAADKPSCKLYSIARYSRYPK